MCPNIGLSSAGQVNTSFCFESTQILECDSQRRSLENKPSPSNLLKPLITSKSRWKFPLRFFVNQDLGGYLQGLSKELDEISKSIRAGFIRLREANMLQTEFRGRRKLYKVDKIQPLTSYLTNMLRKATFIDGAIEMLMERIGVNPEQLWILGFPAQGINSDKLEALLIGQNLHENHIIELISNVEKHIKKPIILQIKSNYEFPEPEISLQVWNKLKPKL